MVEQTKAAEEQRKAATAERLPMLTFNGDYGDIGPTLGHSHGTGDATGTLSVPVFKEFALRGQAEQAQAQLDTARAQLSDKKAQVDADVRDALLDIASAQKQVEVARSSVELADEALKEAQQRYANGVSDNLAVSQAQQSVAQANDQYVASLYRHNVAKLSLARALGAGRATRIIWEGSKRGGFNPTPARPKPSRRPRSSNRTSRRRGILISWLWWLLVLARWGSGGAPPTAKTPTTRR